MTKTIIANIPARTIKLSNGSRQVPARVETITQNEAGCWSIDLGGYAQKITEAEAIDVLRKSSNWEDIRHAHFAMVGFHA